MLGVKRDRSATGELAQGDTVASSAEAQLDPMVREAFLLQTFTEARLDQQVDRALLQHARPNRSLDLSAAANLEHDRLDALEMEQVREQQPCRSRTDDPDLCIYALCSHCSDLSDRIARARQAATNPPGNTKTTSTKTMPKISR